ncbi:uncharacterized protein BXZ73DRAFT_99166 [Epithele typhae]|uniref:uncharacterized protein n=1 Tax=Epithele typhae TaxID=378194 RepID=UPI0020080CA8|nr:uncharacterized protein BXZ73DRAFT_99166 [Epithele typhae]KAH9940167.1 hypothetical protein BXZ73DRAFT_99166 [Epithele typhae]
MSSTLSKTRSTFASARLYARSGGLECGIACPSFSTRRPLRKYGKPGRLENHAVHNLRLEHLSEAHFTATPALHPRFEEPQLSFTYWAKDVERAWEPTVPQLAETLGDRSRYPAFDRLRSLFEPFEKQGVEVDADAEFMLGEDEDLKVTSSRSTVPVPVFPTQTPSDDPA